MARGKDHEPKQQVDWQYSVYEIRGLDSSAIEWHGALLAVDLFVHIARRLAPVIMRTAPIDVAGKMPNAHQTPVPAFQTIQPLSCIFTFY